MLKENIRTLRVRFEQGKYTSDSGIEFSFKINRRYEHKELKSLFLGFGIPEKSEYFEFLIMFGACDIFAKYKCQEGMTEILMQSIEFFRVEKLREINASVSDVLIEDLSQFFLVARNSYSGYYFGFDLSRSTNTFGIFTVDSYPEDWREDTDAWCDFSEWINLLIKTDGRRSRFSKK
ncbi:hypothetical protein FNU79_02215 [Deinococcus detaillensis]|uniref:SMI1/KNR4 family protein n=1 Tax=Deinococcus detaillensis TaxID=2592048 RepID=A0A553V6F5_9DEIO|nr:hypothetical protein [Deinococcus detaillensis]TSA88063.1 hypothetical protein FNU79_02215 [Deinococcus detaillensis]